MRKVFFIAFCLALLLVTPALAKTYTFTDIHATLDLPDNTYDVVLTRDTLSQNTTWLEAQGIDYDSFATQMEEDGVLMEARDIKNGRVFVLTAVKDLDAQNFFDLNIQDEDMRKEFRLGHSENEIYSTLGYHYYSAAWKNYGDTTLRFLQTRYSFRIDNTLEYGGYQRKTIRNGYTITLDLQTPGREAKDADQKALNKIMDSFSFTQILPAPDLPIKLTVTKEPPLETSEDTFTVAGKSKSKANITVTAISLTSSSSAVFNTQANKSGAYSLKVKLPSSGVYSVVVLAEAEDAIAAQQVFSVTYQKGLLPVELTAVPPAVLEDKTVISGKTVSGAKTQVSVTGAKTYQKSTTSSSFKFTLDTSAEGTYNIIVTVTKRGLNTQTFNYTATRTLTEIERYERLVDDAASPSYNNLDNRTSNYEGRLVGYTGYITSVTQAADEWVIGFALKKTGDNYRNIMYWITDTQPLYGEGDQVRAFGTVNGKYTVLSEGSGSHEYPRIRLELMEDASR